MYDTEKYLNCIFIQFQVLLSETQIVWSITTHCVVTKHKRKIIKVQIKSNLKLKEHQIEKNWEKNTCRKLKVLIDKKYNL